MSIFGLGWVSGLPLQEDVTFHFSASVWFNTIWKTDTCVSGLPAWSSLRITGNSLPAAADRLTKTRNMCPHCRCLKETSALQRNNLKVRYQLNNTTTKLKLDTRGVQKCRIKEAAPFQFMSVNINCIFCTSKEVEFTQLHFKEIQHRPGILGN